MHSLWDLPRHRYARLALESSQKLALQGDTTCSYGQMASWFHLHGFSMDRLPPFQYSLDAPSLSITRIHITRLIRQDLFQLGTRRTWIQLTRELGTKMAFYRDQFLQLTEDGFVTRPSYMDTHLSFGIRCAIGQLRTSSHQLEIETGRFRGVRAEARICQLCHLEPETELHYICHCSAYYEIRGRYHCLFREGFGPLSRVMRYEDQRCLGLFLLELRRHRESVLWRTADRQQQRQITDFYRSPDVQSERQTIQQSPGVTLPRGTLIDRATELGRSRRPRRGGTSQHRRRLQRRI